MSCCVLVHVSGVNAVNADRVVVFMLQQRVFREIQTWKAFVDKFRSMRTC